MFDRGKQHHFCESSFKTQFTANMVGLQCARSRGHPYFTGQGIGHHAVFQGLVIGLLYFGYEVPYSFTEYPFEEKKLYNSVNTAGWFLLLYKHICKTRTIRHAVNISRSFCVSLYFDLLNKESILDKFKLDTWMNFALHHLKLQSF